jgi:hypothetical protein
LLPNDTEPNDTEPVEETVPVPEVSDPPETLSKPEPEELSEYIMPTENIENAEVHLDTHAIYKIYEFLNTRIKESLIEDIRGVFTSKKIKSRLDFSEVIDDEETEE